MRCRDIDRLSSRYLDGELDDSRASAVRGHLRRCQRCAERIEDEVELIEAAADVKPIDPPAELWSEIESRLAEEELADADRPRWWMWWHAARPALVMVGAGLAVAAAVAAVFITRDHGESDAVEIIDTPPVTLASSRTHREALSDQVQRADDRYRNTIDELRRLALEERPGWSELEAARFDSRLAELEAAAAAEAEAALASADPRARDPLYRVYREQIDLLQAAALGEFPAEEDGY